MLGHDTVTFVLLFLSIETTRFTVVKASTLYAFDAMVTILSNHRTKALSDITCLLIATRPLFHCLVIFQWALFASENDSQLFTMFVSPV